MDTPTEVLQHESSSQLLWSGIARLHDLERFQSDADDSLMWGNFSQREDCSSAVGPAIAVCYLPDAAGEGVCVPAEVHSCLHFPTSKCIKDASRLCARAALGLSI